MLELNSGIALLGWGTVEVSAVRPIRPHMVVAVAASLGIFCLALINCALLSGNEPVPHPPHSLTAADQTFLDDAVPGHAHVDGPDRDLHAAQPVTHRIRSENPPRLGLVPSVITTVVALLSLLVPTRGPPRSSVPARSGREVLQALCIARC